NHVSAAIRRHHSSFILLFKDPPSSYIYTLSLHDALPIFQRLDLVAPVLRPSHVHAHEHLRPVLGLRPPGARMDREDRVVRVHLADRKSTRLNSSHGSISYAVFCLKKKK